MALSSPHGAMSIAIQTGETLGELAIPSTMRAAVYRGVNDVRLEEVPVPAAGRGKKAPPEPDTGGMAPQPST